MNPAIEYLAKTCANIINSQGLSKSDAILAASKIVELVALGPTTVPTDKDQSRSQERELPAPPTPPSPPAPPAPPKVVAKAGADCACGTCKQVVYQRVADIYDKMKGEDFTKAFKGIGHDKEVARFQNIDGNVLIDCPICGADSSVALIGNVIAHQFSSDVVV